MTDEMESRIQRALERIEKQGEKNGETLAKTREEQAAMGQGLRDLGRSLDEVKARVERQAVALIDKVDPDDIEDLRGEIRATRKEFRIVGAIAMSVAAAVAMVLRYFRGE